jgi:hypothetical protein
MRRELPGSQIQGIPTVSNQDQDTKESFLIESLPIQLFNVKKNKAICQPMR